MNSAIVRELSTTRRRLILMPSTGRRARSRRPDWGCGLRRPAVAVQGFDELARGPGALPPTGEPELGARLLFYPREREFGARIPLTRGLALLIGHAGR